jgi:diguanylate cyclase (GGDEF)-like protein
MSKQEPDPSPDVTFEPIDVLGLNSLQEFRDRSWMILGWAAVPFLFPFSINHFIQNRYFLGALTLTVMLILSVNSLSIYKMEKQLVPFWLFYILLLMTLIYLIYIVGPPALFWCFPALFVMGFVTERTTARTMTVISLFILIPFSFYISNIELASRFVFTLCMICFFSDILVGYLIKLQEKLSRLAVHDPLTNALNRRQLDFYLTEAIEETKRDFGPASLLLLDIDHFKEVNDTHGHEAGDDVLKNVVKILHRRQRRLDHVFRIGGEEFLILLRNTELQHATITAESLRKYVEENELITGQTLTVSIGVAKYKEGESSNEWLARADANLYETKNLGRNRVHPEKL